MQDVQALVDRARAEIESSQDLAGLDAVRVKYLGKKGELTAQLKQLGSLSSEERPAAGQAINQAKQAVQAAIQARKAGLDDARLELRDRPEADPCIVPWQEEQVVPPDIRRSDVERTI